MGSIVFIVTKVRVRHKVPIHAIVFSVTKIHVHHKGTHHCQKLNSVTFSIYHNDIRVETHISSCGNNFRQGVIFCAIYVQAAAFPTTNKSQSSTCPMHSVRYDIHEHQKSMWMEVCLRAHVRLLACASGSQQLLRCSFAIISSCTHDEQRAAFFVQLTPRDYHCVYCLHRLHQQASSKVAWPRFLCLTCMAAMSKGFKQARVPRSNSIRLFSDASCM